MPVSGLGVAYTLSGFVLLWSGVKNASIKDTLTAFLKGTVPAQGPAQDLTIGVTDSSTGSNADSSGAASGASVSDNSIASDALKYVGHSYVYGGAPGTDGTSGWDCSSFCNWVLGHDLGMTLPGDTSPGYSGTSHGPTTLSYLGWSNATTIGHSASLAEAGDLCVWQTHMGIATGGGNMVSALNEQLGTKETTIAGGAPGAEILFVRRIK
jgi:cell wall-associated NlpC family hydrolase